MFELQDLPVSRGTYALRLDVSRAQPIRVGRLGQYHVPAGDYFYVGSAHGAGGLRARVGRHLGGYGNRHWHIDYLRAVAEVQAVFYTVTDNQMECAWSQALTQLPGAFIPIPHFGSSDCRSGCRAHLVVFPQRSGLASVEKALSVVSPLRVVQLRCR